MRGLMMAGALALMAGGAEAATFTFSYQGAELNLLSASEYSNPPATLPGLTATVDVTLPGTLDPSEFFGFSYIDTTGGLGTPTVRINGSDVDPALVTVRPGGYVVEESVSYLAIYGVLFEPGKREGVLYGSGEGSIEDITFGGFDYLTLDGEYLAGYRSFEMGITTVTAVIPLPASAGLLGIGLLGLVARRTRRAFRPGDRG